MSSSFEWHISVAAMLPGGQSQALTQIPTTMQENADPDHRRDTLHVTVQNHKVNSPSTSVFVREMVV
eukprot:1948551-Amphidinium_carterae.1